MELSQPPLIRIYQSCGVLMAIKRKLFQSLNIGSLPQSPLNQEKRTISSRVYLYLKKLTKELKNQLSELLMDPNKSSHIEIVNKVINNLKSHSEFLSQQEKLIMEANKIIEQWHAVEDPLIFYEQNQREELKKSLSSKLSEINTFSVACRQTKKPLYVRKLQRQLKDNLCIIAQNQRKYNLSQYSLALNIRKKVIKLLMKLLESASSKEKSSFVEVEKNLLLNRYIDIFHNKQGKITVRELQLYRQDLLKTLKNIRIYFQEEQSSFSTLLSYMKSLETTIKTFHRQVLNAEDGITDHILDISSDVNHIVNFDETLEVINTIKNFFYSLIEWNQYQTKIPKMNNHINDALILLEQYIQNVSKREIGVSKNQQVSQFIQDKKTLELISKKEESFEFAMFETLGLFLEKLYKNRNSLDFKYMQRDQVKKFKFQKALTNIFQNYFKEIHTNDKSFDGKSSTYQTYKLSLNQKNEIKKIEDFIQSLQVFNEEVDWKDSYFHCSLGPRLLIHGKMKVLPEGILYISNFNKKNYFFGKTRIFIPKQEIFQINKQSALVIFPDVIEVLTTKKGVYFHALGKREKMIEELNEQYFPEVNEGDQEHEDLVFNQFKGNIQITESRLKEYTQNLEYFIGEGDFPNINLRSYFHKYESEEQFHYQGKTYPTFKYFSIQMAEGTNIQGAKFTPGIPYYMEVKNIARSSLNQDIQETQRFFTFKKEVPMIPFVSKGGHGICQEKSIYRWGGPKVLVVDIYTTLSGFSLTQGMLVHARQIFKETKNRVHYQFSGNVTFQTNSAINNMLRAPALSNLKGFMLKLFEVIKKIQKGRKIKKIGAHKMLPEDDELNSRILQLETENAKLKKILLRAGILALLIYLITIFFMIVN